MLPVTRVETKGHTPSLNRSWTEAVETIIFEERRFARSSSYDYAENDTIYSLGGDNTTEQHFRFQSDDDGYDGPHVLCGKCHESKFIIQFGNYSVIAQCVACGMEAEVYSG